MHLLQIGTVKAELEEALPGSFVIARGVLWRLDGIESDAMFLVEYTKSAFEDLQFFQKFEQRLIADTVDRQLATEPLVETRNRKLLRPNELAEWELRIGTFRVFYDVDVPEGVVRIKGIGWKEHNRLLLRGKEFHL